MHASRGQKGAAGQIGPRRHITQSIAGGPELVADYLTTIRLFRRGVTSHGPSQEVPNWSPTT